MTPTRPPLRLHLPHLLPLPTRTPASLLPRRTYTTTPPPPPPSPPKQPSRVASFYRTFSYPILKAFLGALFTYQITYYAWLKLEYAEEKRNVLDRIDDLKGELVDVVVEGRRKSREGEVGVVGGGDEVKMEEGRRKKGWFW
ncbi:unnamed protein product [Periconia digitata]|uniref:Uncharacterized protein n=1 Tax=Periconia digitata TaxID=1303443 RepID=A0A9W4USD9_9PLEO|nr:unnamed protein product [Periconia digitata]